MKSLLTILSLVLCVLWTSLVLAEQCYLYLAVKRNTLGMVGHAVAGVTDPQGKFFVHQVGNNGGSLRRLIRGGYPTSVITAYGHPTNTKYTTYRMPISTTQAANVRAEGRRMVRSDSGRYNMLTNSCATVAASVLKAGGYKPPSWARSPVLLERWFRREGAELVHRASQPRGP